MPLIKCSATLRSAARLPSARGTLSSRRSEQRVCIVSSSLRHRRAAIALSLSKPTLGCLRHRTTIAYLPSCYLCRCADACIVVELPSSPHHSCAAAVALITSNFYCPYHRRASTTMARTKAVTIVVLKRKPPKRESRSIHHHKF